MMGKCGKILEVAFLKGSRKLHGSSWEYKKDSRYKDATKENLRKMGVKFWTTVEYDVVNSIAGAWMPEAFVEKMERDWWRYGLWRVDTWETINYGPFEVRGTVFKEEQLVNAAS
ncbi:hypothetical protein BHYA_0008g00100 [Botrytis hyacinthi]|uniref:Uncharacterized protein n=1 Tax=Botrytis hyacinthi TaxID=278943 RepID=A0A4Z1H3L1_9HELO|nr:hypothetical protein BHYA_0008g00100 [Botrytis hyacinthi]